MNRSGFTLIEMLAVLGIISILSAIAIPRFNSVRDRALVATMQGDLHNLRLAQEFYHRAPDHDFASSLAELGDSYSTSDAVEVTIDSAGRDSYAATATHPGTSTVCTYSTDDGIISCAEGGTGKGAGK